MFTGLLRVQTHAFGGDLLPLAEEDRDPCNEKNGGGCFLGGDTRANENIALLAMHTIWVRLHNQYAKKLSCIHPEWNGDIIYHETRKIIIAILQQITYNEWLPFLVKIGSYRGYKESEDASVRNEFSTAAFRFGHTLVRNSLEQLDKNFEPISDPLPLRDAFFNNTHILNDGIDPTVLGLIGNYSESVDQTFAASVGEGLFLPTRLKERFQNLVALNIQRGRDHGLPSYKKWVEFCHHRVVKSFQDFEEMSESVQVSFAELYDSVHNHIDSFPALLAETPTDDSLLGPTLQCIIGRQFKLLRDGDRFYFERPGQFTRSQLQEIRKMTLAKVLCLTLDDVVSVQREIFKTFDPQNNRRFACDESSMLNIDEWRECPAEEKGADQTLHFHRKMEVTL